jgi:hypothetical protein
LVPSHWFVWTREIEFMSQNGHHVAGNNMILIRISESRQLPQTKTSALLPPSILTGEFNVQHLVSKAVSYVVNDKSSPRNLFRTSTFIASRSLHDHLTRFNILRWGENFRKESSGPADNQYEESRNQRSRSFRTH